MRALPLTALLAMLVAFGNEAGAQVRPGDDAEAVRALFVSRWEEMPRLYPEVGTYRGDDRYGHLWTDASAEGGKRADDWWRDLERRARGIDRSRLSERDRTSLDLLIHEAGENVAFQRFEGARSMSVSAAPFAFQSFFPRLLQATPVNTSFQVEQLLARMRAYPRRIDQEVERLRAGSNRGWVPARPSLERVVKQLDGQLAAAPEESPFFEPFKRLGSEIPAAEQAALRKRGVDTIAQHVLPATRRLRDFVADEYLKAAPEDGAYSRYPQGADAYALLVRVHTTTPLTPRQVHDMGLREVARLRSQMEAAMREAGFAGDFDAFIAHLYTDPRFTYESGDALLAAYRETAGRIDAKLPRLFADLPKARYEVRPLPAFMGEGAAESYNAPSMDGRRPGYFNANLVGFRNRKTWQVEALTAHELIPGHHLQHARAIELEDVPQFRRVVGVTAYNEGWALYAETLGFELDLYKDPYSRFGFLQYQMWRACRLVVDTGIHAFGWTRHGAIAYLKRNTGFDDALVAAEIDRYYSWPGQALAYMIGQVKLIELRDRSKAALGNRFDIKAFHKVVLDTGQVPLSVLERVVDEWLAAQSERKPSPARLSLTPAAVATAPAPAR